MGERVLVDYEGTLVEGFHIRPGALAVLQYLIAGGHVVILTTFADLENLQFNLKYDTPSLKPYIGEIITEETQPNPRIKNPLLHGSRILIDDNSKCEDLSTRLGFVWIDPRKREFDPTPATWSERVIARLQEVLESPA